MRRLLRLLRHVLQRRRFDADLAEEMDFHREMKEREFVVQGADLDEASSAARRALGNVLVSREDARGIWVWPWLEVFVRDMRFGGRLLLKNPGFATIAIVTLIVTIGVNTVVYTLVDHMLVRPLPYPEPDRLAAIARHYERGSESRDGYSQTGATWMALRENLPSLDMAGAGSVIGVNLVAGNETAYVQQQRVSARFFSVLGVIPMLGREFTAEEDQPGGPAVVVLSHALWSRAFTKDVGVIGHHVTLRGEPFTVVGVMPPGFRSNTPADLWTPLRPSTTGEGSGGNYLLVARLRPGVRWADVRGQMESTGSEIARALLHPPPDIHLTMQLVPLRQLLTSDTREPLLILWVAVVMVLLIGCANIAGLMLVRGSARIQEMATRVALGGGRAAIVRQLLAETIVLAACGSFGGIAVGYVLAQALSERLQNVISLPTTPDLRVLAIVTTASFLTSVVFGLMPAVQASRTDVRAMLVESGGPNIAGPARRWPSRLLVVAEIALGIVLVVGAGLLVRSLTYLTHLHPGFDATHVITGSVSLQDVRYQQASRVNDLFTRTIEAIRRTPGVEHAAVALALPYERSLNQGWRFPNEPGSRPEPISVTYVTAEYFDALHIPVARGRVFSARDTDTATPVIVVNEAFVKRYAPSLDLVGRGIMFGAETLQVVGVVGSVQQKVTFGDFGQPLAPVPAAYVPASQFGDGGFKLVHTWFEPSWIVRTMGPQPEIVSVMQRALSSVDPQLPFNQFRTIEEVRGEAVTMARIQASLFGTLATMALLLCGLGVYGLVGYSVAERRREFGVRIALGAAPSDVLKAASQPGIILALLGTFTGLVLAALTARVLQGLIFGVSVRDPFTFTVAASVVVLTAGVAAFVPAMRALQVDVTAVLSGR